MTAPAPSKDHTGENFPVASVLIARRHRPVVMAFYRVARMADDIADQPHADPSRQLAALAAIEATLKGEQDSVPEAVALRAALAARGQASAHILDLLEAFRRDVTKTRYADWAELIDYCRYSAAPVGRFMLETHGESASLWPASDALCSALQVINHLQDCGKDYREIDRVYLPLDALDAAGVDVSTLAADIASPALRKVIAGLAERAAGLLSDARRLGPSVRDAGLALEIAVIQRLAESLNSRLLRRDPLSQRVHHNGVEALGLAILSIGGFGASRLGLGAAAKLGHKDVTQGGAQS